MTRTPKKTTKVSYATPALEKGLDVLELLAHEPAGLTKSEIARRLDRTVSEIFRMLVCLEERGYISQLRGDQYALTLKLFKLVQEHPPTARLIAEATPVMQRFSQETLQSCHMGVIENGRIVILAQVNAPTNVGFYVKLGTSIDIMEASSGYVILAHLDSIRLETTLAEWKRVTGKALPADLHAHLARIRRTGFEERKSYQIRGILNITFPIFDDRGSAVGALTVPYVEPVATSVSRADVVAAVQRAAKEITAAIGGRFPEQV
ncbi:IclR family transcriptional regulator [Terriglobus tenax]|uniref:IclR family transcriptional regulator n=1 Tax=Terriglobus tenax TaxID=1111115 RepID=UPI0021E060A4|nr:IclR family transcriptional regulator [Terriglobus tenax]